MFDPTKPFRTRNGQSVELKFTDGRGVRPLAGYIANGESLHFWLADGRHTSGLEEHPLDLVNVPEWKLPDPPPGREWHCADGVTEGDLPPGYRLLLVGEPLQKEDECWRYGHGPWERIMDESIGRCVDSCFHKHRTKRPLPQETNLTVDDLPHGVEFLSPTGLRNTAALMGPDGIWTGGFFYSYGNLRTQGWKWRADNGDWKPCSKTA